MRLVPRTLFGRVLLALAAGLFLAQLASVVLNVFDRGGSVYRLGAYQIAARIAETSRILDRLPPARRRAVVEALDGRHLSVELSRLPLDVAEGPPELDRYEQAFAESLQRQIGTRWPVSVEITQEPRGPRAPGEGLAASGFEIWVGRHFYFLLPNTFSLVAQVGLRDGTYAVFHAVIPQEPLSRLESLAPQLALLLAISFALAAVLAGMMTRPAARLAAAADAFGADPEGASLPESGPNEIRRVIAAFNRMGAKVRAHVLEREKMLGAISHDLKTPITRMRLRAEMLGDEALRSKMLRDLDDMDAMVRSTLEFFRDLDRDRARQPVDLVALVESLCEDRREAGEAVSFRGAVAAPYLGQPQALRRCLENLVENAVRYGGSAEIEIDEAPGGVRIAVRDRGPGIPAEETERVFEPFYRLESSRNRASGGTGLGLSIARNIARWHGGEIRLRNAAEGGLIAELVLPR